MRISQWLGIGLTILAQVTLAQQLPDFNYRPEWPNPPHAQGAGPLVALDAGHNNFHTLNGGFSAFGNILAAGGFVVQSHEGGFDELSLDGVDILVIANPLDYSNVGNWTLPCPSAFTEEEMDALQNWVDGGGRLVLIADHMPFGGAVADLAGLFGLQWYNGFASIESSGPGDLLSEVDPFLHADSIHNFRTFTGSAMEPSLDFHSLMVLSEGDLNLPSRAWNFDSLNTRMPLEGKWQACWRTWGRGAIVCLGEAASLTSQLIGPDKIPVGVSMENIGGNLGFIQDMFVVLSPNNSDLLQALNQLRKAEKLRFPEGIPDILEFYTEGTSIIGPEGLIKWENFQKEKFAFNDVSEWGMEAFDWRDLPGGRVWLSGRAIFIHNPNGEASVEFYFETIWSEVDGMWKMEEVWLPGNPD